MRRKQGWWSQRRDKGRKGGEIGRRSKEPAAKNSGGLEFSVARPEEKEAEAHPQGEKLFSV